MIEPASTIAVAHGVHQSIQRLHSAASNSAKLLKLKGSLKELDTLMELANSTDLKKHQNPNEWIEITNELNRFYTAYEDLLPRYLKKNLLQRVFGYAEIKREVDGMRAHLERALQKIETANAGSNKRKTRLNNLRLRLNMLRNENEMGMTSVEAQEREERAAKWEVDSEEIIKQFREMCDGLTDKKEYALKAYLVDHTITSMLEIADSGIVSPNDDQQRFADKGTNGHKSHSNTRARGKKTSTTQVRFQSGDPASPSTGSVAEHAACDLAKEIIEVESDASDDAPGTLTDDNTDEGTADL